MTVPQLLEPSPSQLRISGSIPDRGSVDSSSLFFNILLHSLKSGLSIKYHVIFPQLKAHQHIWQCLPAWVIVTSSKTFGFLHAAHFPPKGFFCLTYDEAVDEWREEARHASYFLCFTICLFPFHSVWNYLRGHTRKCTLWLRLRIWDIMSQNLIMIFHDVVYV